ncbi:MAG: PD-(D/E)XK nuclease family protein [Pseudomonadota bacterium]|nr:PD-(D/E)XK nuclease family protein [Pseudomonadota bacterium]
MGAQTSIFSTLEWPDLNHTHTVVCDYGIQARLLARQWQKHQQSMQKDVVLLPCFTSYHHWLKHAYYMSSVTQCRVLDHHQSYLIWQQLIHDDQPHLTDDQLHDLTLNYQGCYQNADAIPLHYQTIIQAYRDYLNDHQLTDVRRLEQTLNSWYQPSQSTHLVCVCSQYAQPERYQLMKSLPNTQPMSFLRLNHHHKRIANTFSKLIFQYNQVAKLLQSQCQEYERPLVGVILHQPSARDSVIAQLSRLTDHCEFSSAADLIDHQTTPVTKRPLIRSLLALADYMTLFLNRGHVPEHDVFKYLYPYRLNTWSIIQWPSNLNSILHDLWQSCHVEVHEFGVMYDFEVWSVFYSRLLDELGWSSLCLSDAEQADWQLWLEAFDQAKPWQLSQPIRLETWLKYITCCLKNTHDKRHISPFVFLSWSEAQFVPFDMLIQCDADSSHWPCQSEVCLSISDWRQAQANCVGAEHYVFSALMDEQDQVLTPSPLIEHWQAIQVNPNLEPAESDLECFPSTTLTYPPKSNKPISSSPLTAAAECPTKAYLQYHLGLRKIEHLPILSVSMRHMGQLIHDAISDSDLVNQYQRNSLSNYDIACFLDRCNHLYYKRLPKWQQTMVVSHVLTEVLRWYDYTNGVDSVAPERVEHERSLQMRMETSDFNLRADRIDWFKDESCHIIDYKLGKVSKHQWLTSPLIAPQLPLYALSQPRCKGIFFACLHPDAYGYQGIATTKRYSHTQVLVDDDSPQSWSKQLAVWQSQIARLTQTYTQGLVQNKPYQSDATCDMCGLSMICRRHEAIDSLDIVLPT